MKIFKGYIFSRRLSDGRYVPQKIQNLTIRNTCERFNVKFILSSTEYIFANSYSMLQELTKNYLKEIDGIAFFSLFQLPGNKSQRNSLLKNIFKQNKEIIMCNEKIHIKSEFDLELIDNYINISKALKYSPSKNDLLNNLK